MCGRGGRLLPANRELKGVAGTNRMMYTVYITMMHRTQIYLPERLHRRLKQAAARRKCSMAKLLRESIERDYGILPKEGNAQVLLELLASAKRLAKERPPRKPAPADLSENHDYYLYGSQAA